MRKKNFRKQNSYLFGSGHQHNTKYKFNATILNENKGLVRDGV